MGKLASYVMRTAFWAMAAGVLGLWLLQMVFAYLGEIERVSDSYTIGQALQYIAYRAPAFLVQFIPTGVLMGAVIGLGLLANHSEIVVMRAAGISLYRLLLWVMAPAFLFVALSLALSQWLLPVANLQAKSIKYPAQYQKSLTLDGYWSVTPDGAGGQRIVHIGHADTAGNLGVVRQFEVHDAKLRSVLSAESGVYVGDQDGYTWQLSKTYRVDLGQTAAKRWQGQALALSLPIDKRAVYLLTKSPNDLSISQLYEHGQIMRHQKTRSKPHELAFWQKLLSPLSVFSLLLVACSFVFGSLRSQSLGFRVVMALLAGVLFSYVQDLSGFIALATAAPPMAMVLLPVVVSAALGLYLLFKKG